MAYREREHGRPVFVQVVWEADTVGDLPPASAVSFLDRAVVLADNSFWAWDGRIWRQTGGTVAVTIADGADVAEGATADAAVVTDTVGTLSGKLRGLIKWAFERMPASLGQKAMAASLPVVVASDQSAVPVSGTFFQATQPVSLAVAPSTPVTGTFFQATQPVSAASLPLPAGASTAALQTQPGVDIGDVTVNNGVAGAAVNVQDGGNSLTVDGTVTGNPATYFGKTITYVNVNQGAAGTTVLAAAQGANKHKVVGLALTMSLTGTLKLTDGVVDLVGPFDFAVNGGFVIPAGILPISETGDINRALNLVTTLGAARGVVAILSEP